jgi:uncharacterized protein
MSMILQFLIGLLFGLGLVVSGMSDPAKVINFLDLAAIPTGGWDASLAFVMAGAVIVTAIGYRFVLVQPKPLFDRAFHLPDRKRLDHRILVGPAIFGIGWGMAGFCPGPAFATLGTGSAEAMLFVLAMLAGMAMARFLALRQFDPMRIPAE